jgi:hypothetical protein
MRVRTGRVVAALGVALVALAPAVGGAFTGTPAAVKLTGLEALFLCQRRSPPTGPTHIKPLAATTTRHRHEDRHFGALWRSSLPRVCLTPGRRARRLVQEAVGHEVDQARRRDHLERE